MEEPNNSFAEQFPLPSEPRTQGVVVSKEDLLEAENLHLRTISLGYEIEKIQLMLNQKIEQHASLHKEIMAKRHTLEQTYGINLTTHFIHPHTREVMSRSELEKPPESAVQERS